MNRVMRFIKITSIFFISLFSEIVVAQTDTDFWFVVPEITVNHGFPGGIPANMRFATFDLPATVTISMPANSVAFPDIVINIPANSTGAVDLSNWVYSAGAEQNKLENKTLNASGINNFGLHITSTSLITAYYEISNSWNTDIWALKGSNALGTDFFTPFQTHGANGNYGAPDGTAQPYSAIDIVATENNTTVTVTPSKIAGYGNAGATIAANTPKTFILNKGQTLSIYPQNKSQAAANRLAGTHVTSDKPIAVSLKDDSIIHPSGGCRDVAGDEIVPVNIIGVEYIVMRTFLNLQDYVYVVATQNNTPIYVEGVLQTTLNAGQQYQIVFPTTYPTGYMKIASRLTVADPYKPIYVFHIGGFGCEQGGAICPPIDKCTGSTEVAFTRPKPNPFYLTLMVRDGAQDGFLVNGVVRNDLIPPGSFVLVPGTPWRVARLGSFSTAQFAVGQHLVENTKDIFHLGIVNGDAGTTCMYGYFSDFNVFNPKSFVLETGGPGNTLCYGESSQLFAKGGTKYQWSPDDFLDDPFSNKPIASNVTKSLKYKVVVSGVCNLKDSAEIELIVAPYINPKFTTDVFSGCAPLTVNITNNSTGVSFSEWDLNNDGDLADPGEGLNNAPTFSHVFDNLTNDTIRYEITLIASDASSICFKQVTKTILVYPRISASFTTTIPDALRCHPLSVTFNNTSTTNGASYSWNFGDGGSSYDKDPIHVYNNFNIAATTYNTGSLLVTDKYNNCKATVPISITVQPYIKASFVVDKVESCSPFNLTVLNDSKGGVNNYLWDRDGDIATGPSGFEYSVPTATGWTLPYTNTTAVPKAVNVRLKVTNSGGCSDIVTRTITVNPQVTASFATNNNGNPLGCSPLSLNLASTTTNATIYQWLIDGNTFDNQTTAAYTFNNFTAAPVTKVVSFTASNIYGCSANQTSNVIVQPYVNADVALDNEIGCSPLTVNFNNTSSIGASSFQWDFENDGSVDFSTKNIPAQIFANPSITNVVRNVPFKLTATNIAGCTSSIVKNITVNPQSTASFTYTDAGNLNHCSPFSTTFTSTVTNTDTYQWEFGTYGASTSANPSFMFTNDGIADVTVPILLKTNNSFGCSATTSQNLIVRPGVKALFSIDKTAGCPPYDATVSATMSAAITNYTWDFDGVPYTGANQIFPNPSNLTGLDITKNITLTVGNGFCSDATSKSIVVYPQVDARYTASVLSGCSPLTVDFASQSALYGTLAPVNNIVWDFKDASTAITTPITHTFVNPDHTNPQIFNVTLTATSNQGCTETETVPITVNPTVNAAFNTLIIQPCTPVRVNVKDVSFAGPTISTFTWSYPGGVLLPPEDKDFDIDFDNVDPINPVNRTITLNISNTFGCTSSKSQNFVIDPKVNVALALTAPVDGGGTPIDRLCAPAKFTFANNSTGADLTYTWDFKDGVTQTTNTTASFDHIFENRTATTKQFDVQLTAVNLKGCSGSATRSVWAYPEVDAKFSMTRDSSCTPFYIKLKDESLNGTQWSWDFGHTILGVPQTRTSIVPGETFTKLIDNETVTDQIKNYKILLTLNDLVTGCKDTISQKLVVYPRVTSNFTVSPISGCSPTIVTFTNSSSGLGSYLWELDNGLSFNQTTPVPLSISNSSTVNEKIINVKLTSTNVLGCKAVSSKTVTIAPTVKASFTSSILEGCDPFTANFTNLTPSTAYNYSWSVNGTPQVVTQDYSRNFTNLSNPPVINKYKILLESSYILNATCKDTVSKTITVYPRVYPNFTFSNVAGCHPLTTDLTNSTVSYNNSATYSWNLGNGIYSNLKDLTNQLYKNNSSTKDTTYSIKLTATSIHQCVDDTTKSIIVHPKPIASYIMSNESVSCSPFLVTLNNYSNGKEPLSYTFDMDDGTFYNPLNKSDIVNHTYHNNTSNNKDYTITLTTSTTDGCSHSTSQTVYAFPEVTANFGIDFKSGCSPLTVNFSDSTSNGYFYHWVFGDGTNSNLQFPNHRFVNLTEDSIKFDVKLTSVSAYDCVHDTTKTIWVYATPRASIGIDPPLKVFPDSVFLINNMSSPAADDWTYAWDFGDGFTSSLKNPVKHRYLSWAPNSNGNIYTVKLRIDAPKGCFSETSNILRLLPAPPVSIFDDDTSASCPPLEVHFLNNSVYGNNYFWEFGDGNTSTEREPIYTFNNPGIYLVKLTVSGDGGSSFYYKPYRVFQKPIASFKVYPYRVMLPDAEVHVYNLTKYADRYEWDLGDNSPLVYDKEVVHKYTALGQFRITLKAFAHDSLGGCEDDTSTYPAVWVEGVGKVDFPNAFVPNKGGSNGGIYDDVDYKNEVFHPVHDGVVEYKLIIFNRWGEQLFESTDIKKGWDGYYKGKLCDQGVYIWRAIGKFTNGRSFDKKGNVTLLR